MLAQINMNNQELTTLVSPEAALARGSSFANLYIPYKFEINFDPNSFIQTEDPTLKIGKARVSYKHLNRNGSYIRE
jgi:hypothetical protein